MFVNIIHFPPVREGKDAEFREWFEWSNEVYSGWPGFISRKLLQPRDGGNYAALVQHESYETFMAMHTSDDQAGAKIRVHDLLEGSPKPEFYEAVLG
ncbi:MAG: antibiotic biosynthesis monooxygenase [Actinomycetota bacterium]|nr:antibiotic biosynthesis monooxygenase [Actinomycetota bacterium]